VASRELVLDRVTGDDRIVDEKTEGEDERGDRDLRTTLGNVG
jgi:hypothetical protein